MQHSECEKIKKKKKRNLKPQVSAKAIIVTNQTPSHRRTKTVSLFMDAEGVGEVCLAVVVGGRGPRSGDSLIGRAAKAADS